MMEIQARLGRSLSGVAVSPALRCRILRSIALEGQKRTPARRRMPAAVALALIVALLAVGIALAATRGFGWFKSGGDDVISQNDHGGERKRSGDSVREQAVPASSADGQALSFRVLSSYYDGANAAFTFQLNAPDRSYDLSWRPTAAELACMEKVEAGHDMAVWESFDRMNEALSRVFSETGACGVLIHNYYLGDHAFLSGGEDSGGYIEDTSWQNSRMTGYVHCEGLPETARGKDRIELVLPIMDCKVYYYKDASGVLYLQAQRRAVQLDPVAIPQGEGKLVDVQGYRKYDGYAACADVSVSPVRTSAVIWQKLPGEWVTADSWTRDLVGVDFPKDYLLVVKGEATEGIEYGEGYGNEISGSWKIPERFRNADPKTLYAYEIAFPGVPEGVREVALRPIYSISGPRPDEDIALKLK